MAVAPGPSETGSAAKASLASLEWETGSGCGEGAVSGLGVAASRGECEADSAGGISSSFLAPGVLAEGQSVVPSSFAVWLGAPTLIASSALAVGGVLPR